ncbi:MAG: YetF domain-containing protein [Blastocatellia bacterium]
MSMLLQIDWDSMFIPSLNLWEIFLRGTVVYLFLFGLLRVVRREAGAIGISDLLVVVLIADAAQNAMASEYKSITEGLALVATIAFWDYSLDWLGYRFPGVRRLLRPPPLLLIKDGRIQRRNLRQEMITEEELMGQLREQGVEAVEEVKKSYMEADGHISVITKDAKEKKVNERKKLAP